MVLLIRRTLVVGNLWVTVLLRNLTVREELGLLISNQYSTFDVLDPRSIGSGRIIPRIPTVHVQQNL